MNTDAQLQCEFAFGRTVKPASRRVKPPQEFKIIALRESPVPERQWLCETPSQFATYWRCQIATTSWYSPERECAVVVLVNRRNRVLGHHLIAIGTLDSLVLHPREALRAAVIAAAHGVILGHNHPSGDPTPSGADIEATRDLVRAGQVLRIDVLDHVVIGNGSFFSLRQAGFFA